MGMRGRRGVLVLSLLMAILGAMVPGSAFAAVEPAVKFHLDVDGCWLSGEAPPNKAFNIQILRSDGVSKGTYAAASSSNGSWGLDDCIDEGFAPGDKIKTLNLGGGNDRTFTVPNITVNTDRVKNRIWGKVPAGADIFGYVEQCLNYSWQSCTVGYAGELANATNGTFNLTKAEFSPSVNPRGGDWYSLLIATLEGDELYTGGQFASMVISSTGRFHVHTRPDELGTLELRSSGGATRATARFLGDEWGDFAGRLRLPNRNPAYPAPGEIVWGSFASDALMTVPGPFSASAATDTVSGKCFPGRGVFVQAYDPTGEREEGWSERIGTANSTGAFSLKLRYAEYPAFNLMSGDRVSVLCRNNNGDQYEHSLRVP